VSRTQTLSREIFFQFPWLNGADHMMFTILGLSDQQVQESSLTQLIRTIFDQYPEMKSRILKFFEIIIRSGEDFVSPSDDEINLALYPLVQIIVSMFSNRIFANGLTNLYAKHCQSTIENRQYRNRYKDSVIIALCSNVGINCQLKRMTIDATVYPYMMDFSSFLKSSTKMNREDFKLINRIVIDGRVYLTKHDVIMLLREYVRLKVRPDIKKMDEDLLNSLREIPEIKEIEDQLQELISQHAERFNSSLIANGEKITSEFFAPCIKSILYRAVNGENLSHYERLAIAFYYLNTNHTIEETVDIFRTSPDFDEKIARYQVEFAAGANGIGKKYSMYSCKKLKSLNLCKADDPTIGEKICAKGAKNKKGEFVQIRSPISDYIFWKKVEMKRLHRAEIAAAEKVQQEQEKQ
jgi:DNA primase large subunit